MIRRILQPWIVLAVLVALLGPGGRGVATGPSQDETNGAFRWQSLGASTRGDADTRGSLDFYTPEGDSQAPRRTAPAHPEPLEGGRTRARGGWAVPAPQMAAPQARQPAPTRGGGSWLQDDVNRLAEPPASPGQDISWGWLADDVMAAQRAERRSAPDPVSWQFSPLLNMDPALSRDLNPFGVRTPSGFSDPFLLQEQE